MFLALRNCRTDKDYWRTAELVGGKVVEQLGQGSVIGENILYEWSGPKVKTPFDNEWIGNGQRPGRVTNNFCREFMRHIFFGIQN